MRQSHNLGIGITPEYRNWWRTLSERITPFGFNRFKRRLRMAGAVGYGGQSGRPTTFSDVLGDLICLLIAEGKSLNRIYVNRLLRRESAVDDFVVSTT